MGQLFRALLLPALPACFLAGCFLLLPASTVAGEPVPALEPVILQTQINQQSYGQLFFFLDPAGEVYVSPSALEQLGLEKNLWQTWENQESFPLRLLAPALRHTFDDIHASLSIEADPSVLATQRIAVQPLPEKASTRLTPSAPRSAFINYSLALRHSTSGLDFSLPIEAALRSGEWLAYSNAVYQPDTGLRRFMSQLTWDQADRMQRIVLGDFVPVRQEINPAPVLAGLSVRNFFAMQPDFSPYPKLEWREIMPLPATVEVYVNDTLVDDWTVKPGPLLLTDWLHYAGQGRLSLRVKDIFGHERELTHSYLISGELLAPGLHEYQYDAGWQRKNLGQANFDYGAWVVSGQHRYGLTPQMTGALGFEWMRGQQLWSPQLSWVWAGRWHNSLSLKYLRQATGEDAYAAGLHSQLHFQNFTVEAGAEHYTHNWPAASGQSALQGRESVKLSWYPGAPWGSVSLYYEQARYLSQAEKNRLMVLNYQNSFSENWHFLLTLRRTSGNSEDWAVLASLDYRLGKNQRLRLRSDYQADQQRYKLTLDAPLKRGLNHGYRLSVQHNSPDAWLGDARWQANRRYGKLEARYARQADGSDATALEWAGALSWLSGHGIYFSRPIEDSFALVETGKENVPIQVGGQVLGVTGEQGSVILPEIASLYENRLRVPLEALPLNYSLRDPVQILRPPYRSGTRLAFDLQRISAIEGYLHLENGEPVEQARWQLEGRPETGMIGKEGYFYLENLPPGRYRGHLPDKRLACWFDLEVAESEEVVQNLGTLDCRRIP